MRGDSITQKFWIRTGSGSWNTSLSRAYISIPTTIVVFTIVWFVLRPVRSFNDCDDIPKKQRTYEFLITTKLTDKQEECHRSGINLHGSKYDKRGSKSYGSIRLVGFGVHIIIPLPKVVVFDLASFWFSEWQNTNTLSARHNISPQPETRGTGRIEYLVVSGTRIRHNDSSLHTNTGLHAQNMNKVTKNRHSLDTVQRMDECRMTDLR